MIGLKKKKYGDVKHLSIQKQTKSEFNNTQKLTNLNQNKINTDDFKTESEQQFISNRIQQSS